MFSFIIRAPEGHCNRECISVARSLSSEIVIQLISFTHLMTVSQDCAEGIKTDACDAVLPALGELSVRGDRNKIITKEWLALVCHYIGDKQGQLPES